MVTKNRWKIAIVLALIVFSTLSLIALVEVFFPLFKFFALDYSVSVFIGVLTVFSMYDLVLLHFFFLFFKSSPVEQTTLRMAVRFVCAGLVISILIKCFYIFYYLFQWRFLPALFSDIWFILSDLTTYTPFMIFLYFFHRQLKNIKDSRMKTPCFFSLIGAVVIVFLNGITLFSLLFPGIFSWFFTIEFSIIITLPRALSFFSFLYLFFAFLKRSGDRGNIYLQ
jgi:hypothetical protein